MAHYAELNDNNEVINILYIPNDQIKDDDGIEVEEKGISYLKQNHGEHRVWIQTSIFGNFRNKSAVIGDTYRKDLDMFISPKPYPSWILNTETGLWESPVLEPKLTDEQKDNLFFTQWDEENQNWIVDQLKINSEN